MAVSITGSDLRNGKTKSCGCSRIIHGHATKRVNSKIYRAWADMIQRCTNSSHRAYQNYGGRGISVCIRWLRFENFLQDMGNPPNCQWTTSKINNRNRRNNHMITFRGKTKCLQEWAKEMGLSHQIILWRLNHGWSVSQSLTESIGARSWKGRE